MALESDADLLSFVGLPSHLPFEQEKGYFFFSMEREGRRSAHFSINRELLSVNN